MLQKQARCHSECKVESRLTLALMYTKARICEVRLIRIG